MPARSMIDCLNLICGGFSLRASQSWRRTASKLASLEAIEICER
jgi:hypothetical protein